MALFIFTSGLGPALVPRTFSGTLIKKKLREDYFYGCFTLCIKEHIMSCPLCANLPASYTKEPLYEHGGLQNV
jgi:hypothetical protein